MSYVVETPAPAGTAATASSKVAWRGCDAGPVASFVLHAQRRGRPLPVGEHGGDEQERHQVPTVETPSGPAVPADRLDDGEEDGRVDQGRVLEVDVVRAGLARRQVDKQRGRPDQQRRQAGERREGQQCHRQEELPQVERACRVGQQVRPAAGVAHDVPRDLADTRPEHREELLVERTPPSGRERQDHPQAQREPDDARPPAVARPTRRFHRTATSRPRTTTTMAASSLAKSTRATATA